MSGSSVKMFGVNQDITEQKSIEESLRKANQKLNLLSSITRHDIMNQLTIQSGYLGLVKNSISDTYLLSRIKDIERSIRQIQKQIEFTRDYEKMGVMPPQWWSIEKIINDLSDLSGVEHLDISENVHGLIDLC